MAMLDCEGFSNLIRIYPLKLITFRSLCDRQSGSKNERERE